MLIKKIIFIFTMFVFFAFNIDNVQAAEWEQNTYLRTNLQLYYYNLDTNCVHNDTNKWCGFEAFAKLLSYYYNFYNEQFISYNHYNYYTQLDEKQMLDYLCEYDSKTSPGVNYVSRYEYEIPPTTIEGDGTLYFYNNVYDYHYNDNFSFLGYLFKICEYENVYERGEVIQGINTDVIVDLYNKYFEVISEEFYFNASNYNFIFKEGGMTDNKSEQYRNEVIGYIQSGYPVICNFLFTEDDGHSCLCYDYDEITDFIYCNTELLEEDEMVLKKHYNTYLFTSTGEGILDSYYVIVPNDSYSHACCYPYYTNESEYNYYCYCEVSQNPHNFSFTLLNHICSTCGLEENHDFIYFQNNNFSHIKKCEICMYQINEPHNMEIHNTYSICSICRYRRNTTDIPIVTLKKEEEENEQI